MWETMTPTKDLSPGELKKRATDLEASGTDEEKEMGSVRSGQDFFQKKLLLKII